MLYSLKTSYWILLALALSVGIINTVLFILYPVDPGLSNVQNSEAIPLTVNFINDDSDHQIPLSVSSYTLVECVRASYTLTLPDAELPGQIKRIQLASRDHLPVQINTQRGAFHLLPGQLARPLVYADDARGWVSSAAFNSVSVYSFFPNRFLGDLTHSRGGSVYPSVNDLCLSGDGYTLAVSYGSQFGLDIFVRDRTTGVWAWASEITAANSYVARGPAISPDGRFLAIRLVNSGTFIYERTVNTHQYTVQSTLATSGLSSEERGSILNLCISSDGRFLLYPGVTNIYSFTRNAVTNLWGNPVTVTSDGVQGRLVMSGDGRSFWYKNGSNNIKSMILIDQVWTATTTVLNSTWVLKQWNLSNNGATFVGLVQNPSELTRIHVYTRTLNLVTPWVFSREILLTDIPGYFIDYAMQDHDIKDVVLSADGRSLTVAYGYQGYSPYTLFSSLVSFVRNGDRWICTQPISTPLNGGLTSTQELSRVLLSHDGKNAMTLYNTYLGGTNYALRSFS